MGIKANRKSHPVVEVPVVQERVETYNYRQVIIESLFDAHLVYTGQETGKQYVWPHSGSTQSVDERDVPALLSKRIGERSCCGQGLQGNLVFQKYNSEE